MTVRVSVRRVDFGYFVRPATETVSGRARAEPCLGYVVLHPEGVLLFDTGMGSDPDVDARYRPQRRPLVDALAEVDVRPDDVDLVANCHLHFDHCGGNPQLAGRPVICQATELSTARATEGYTLPELVDAPGVRYQELAGESEILPGMFLIPTPGHTAGHQSLVVRDADGTVVVVGQAHDTASDFSTDALAGRARREGVSGHVPVPPAWMDRLMALDPARVVFAHDHAVWVP